MSTEMPRPRVSIVVAAYQAAEVLPRVIRQIQALTFTDYEVVLVDDGSTDGTLEAMKVAAEQDTRFRVIALPENRGVGAARRAGFSATRGTFVWNVDADDEWPAGALTALVDAIGNADVVLASATRRRSSGRTTRIQAPSLGPGAGARDGLALLLAGSITGHLWNKLIRAELLDEQVYTDARLHSDLIMTTALLARARSIASTDVDVYTYVETPGSNIRSSRPRGISLELASAAVDRALAAAAPDLLNSRPYVRFRARSIVLSRMRDAVRGDYEEQERRARLAAARRDVGAGDVTELVRAGDLKSAILITVAKLSPAVFQRVMRR